MVVYMDLLGTPNSCYGRVGIEFGGGGGRRVLDTLGFGVPAFVVSYSPCRLQILVTLSFSMPSPNTGYTFKELM